VPYIVTLLLAIGDVQAAINSKDDFPLISSVSRTAAFDEDVQQTVTFE
jgi:hypothetical protein